jgi:hypothetical protein
MYWTETNPFTNAICTVEKSAAGRERQKAMLTGTISRTGSGCPAHRKANNKKQ